MQDNHDLHTLTAYEFIVIIVLCYVVSKESGWRRGKELPKSREHENRDAIKVDRSMVFQGEKNRLTIPLLLMRMNGKGASHSA